MNQAGGGTGAPGAVDVAIRSGDDVAAALRHPDTRVRFALLRDIAADPAKVGRYGGGEGRDLVEELTLLCDEAAGSADRVAYAYALLQIDDPRVLTFAEHEFAHGTHAKLALEAAGQLARLPARERVRALAPVVLTTTSPTRARAAANLLADLPDLDPAVGLRVALLTDHAVAPPALDASTLDLWLAELRGDRPAGARERLRSLGPPAMRELLLHWDALDYDLRVWTLRWAADEPVPESAMVVRRVLVDGASEPVLLAALRLVERLPSDPRMDRAVRALDDHPSDVVRAAAVGVGPAPAGLLGRLAKEGSERVRLAIIGRLPVALGAGAIGPLRDLLDDDAWRVRARAAGALAALAPASLDVLRDASLSDRATTRIAAARALSEAGREDLLDVGS